MKRIVLALFLLLGAGAATATANYTYYNGYWYDAYGQAYTRTQYYQPAYRGCCGYYYYTYTPYYTVQPVVAAPITSTTPDWRTKVLEIAAAGKEHQYFMDAVTALNIKAPDVLVPQAVRSGYGYQQSYGQPFFAPQASTVYGHYQQEKTTFWGDTDMMALYQMQNRTVENVSKMASSTASDQAALINQAAQNAKDIAEIRAREREQIAKAHAMAIVFEAGRKALDDKKITIESKGQDFKVVPKDAPEGKEPPANPGLEKLGLLFQRDCAQCHSDKKQEGKLNLKDWPTFDPLRKMEVWKRVTTTDQDKAMPRLEGGGVGKRWTPEEAKLLLIN